jgi:cytochrome P450
VQPDEFIPERWTTRPELIINKSACIPFVMGPYKCPGKAIAMMELRSVIAKTVSRYDISFPKGAKFDVDDFFLGVKDHFTAGIPLQELVFTQRKE